MNHDPIKPDEVQAEAVLPSLPPLKRVPKVPLAEWSKLVAEEFCRNLNRRVLMDGPQDPLPGPEAGHGQGH